jgi:FdhD protein
MNSAAPGRSAEPSATDVTLEHWTASAGFQTKPDLVAAEEPLEIRVQGRCLAVTMRTPGADAELAAGFLVSEGLLRQREDLLEIAHCRQGEVDNAANILNVFLARGLEVNFEKLSRHVFASSSCGICGKATIESVHQQFPPIRSDIVIAPELLIGLPQRLRDLQRSFALTGGIHAAAIFDAVGNALAVQEDVGRHNAVDKVIGVGFLENRLPFESHILLVSGRASFEIVQKALAARIPIVAAISAPSSLAVDFARESGQTLVGFLRDGAMNIYAGRHRIAEVTPQS